MDSTTTHDGREGVAAYPRRPSHFAHKYTRLLTKTCAAQEIGHIAFTLEALCKVTSASIRCMRIFNCEDAEDIPANDDAAEEEIARMNFLYTMAVDNLRTAIHLNFGKLAEKLVLESEATISERDTGAVGYLAKVFTASAVHTLAAGRLLSRRLQALRGPQAEQLPPSETDH